MFKIKKSPELVSANIRARKEFYNTNLCNLFNNCKFVLTIIISIEGYSIGEWFIIQENYNHIIMIAFLLAEVNYEK